MKPMRSAAAQEEISLHHESVLAQRLASPHGECMCSRVP